MFLSLDTYNSTQSPTSTTVILLGHHLQVFRPSLELIEDRAFEQLLV
jgi:hypothetical protein